MGLFTYESRHSGFPSEISFHSSLPNLSWQLQICWSFKIIQVKLVVRICFTNESCTFSKIEGSVSMSCFVFLVVCGFPKLIILICVCVTIPVGLLFFSCGTSESSKTKCLCGFITYHFTLVICKLLMLEIYDGD